MQKRFGLITSLSDHTIDNTTAITSVPLSVSIIEKYVTLDRNGGGPDDSFSLEPKELKQLCVGAKTAWESLGQIDYGRKSSEQANVKFRRSIYAIQYIKRGEQLTEENVKRIRPKFCLAPKYWNEVISSIATSDIIRGEPISFNLISNTK